MRDQHEREKHAESEIFGGSLAKLKLSSFRGIPRDVDTDTELCAAFTHETFGRTTRPGSLVRHGKYAEI